jgi:hypothetical protein
VKTLFTALLLLLPFVTRTAAAEVRVYKGTSTFTSDIVCTVRDGKVYQGTSDFQRNILFTLRDGKIYKGTSSFTSDILATVRDGKVYEGTSSFQRDVLFTVDGYLTVEEFFAVWHAVRYVY